MEHNFKINDVVLVSDPREGDLFNHSFIGMIVELKENTVVVEDAGGDCFELDYDQIEISE